VQPRGGRLVKLWGSSLYHRDDLPFKEGCGDVPDVFTPFKEKAERMGKVGAAGLPSVGEGEGRGSPIGFLCA
jgi:deoxyribodipyrimidine photo-lyase